MSARLYRRIPLNQELKVSIICDVYNHGSYLRDALEGFVSQKTNFPIEILVHDDASTDNSAEIIREYEAKYPAMVKPLYQTVNQYSQNVYIDKTFQIPRITGKYVAVCEGDDFWTDPLKLQKQVDFLENNPEYSLCACSTIRRNMKTGLDEQRYVIQEDMDISFEDLVHNKTGGFFQYASIVMRSDVFVQRPDWFQKFPIGDYPLVLMAALNGKVHMLKDVMTVYRYYAANSWTVRMDNDERRAKVSQQMIEALEALDADTNYQHHEVVNQRIKRHKYTLALMQHDYQALQSEELKAMFNARSLPRRMSDLIRCKYPKLFEKVGKPLVRLIKSKNDE